jgi:hypothetical protein
MMNNTATDSTTMRQLGQLWALGKRTLMCCCYALSAPDGPMRAVTRPCFNCPACAATQHQRILLFGGCTLSCTAVQSMPSVCSAELNSGHSCLILTVHAMTVERCHSTMCMYCITHSAAYAFALHCYSLLRIALLLSCHMAVMHDC